MENNGDLKRNRAMSAGARRFFLRKHPRDWDSRDVIGEWGDRYRLRQRECSARPKRLQRQSKDRLVVHPRVNTNHPVVQSTIGFLIRILKSLCHNSINRYHIVFSILQ